MLKLQCPDSRVTPGLGTPAWNLNLKLRYGVTNGIRFDGRQAER